MRTRERLIQVLNSVNRKVVGSPHATLCWDAADGLRSSSNYANWIGRWGEIRIIRDISPNCIDAHLAELLDEALFFFPDKDQPCLDPLASPGLTFAPAHMGFRLTPTHRRAIFNGLVWQSRRAV